MEGALYRYTKKLMKQNFPSYKRIQVAATLKEVIVTRKKKRGIYIGTNLYEDTTTEERVLPLVIFRDVFLTYSYTPTKHDLHRIYVAVDQRTKTVYWNFEKLNNVE